MLQCLFADPFTSFRGVERFKTNLGNFSKFTYALVSTSTSSALHCERIFTLTVYDGLRDGSNALQWEGRMHVGQM